MNAVERYPPGRRNVMPKGDLHPARRATMDDVVRNAKDIGADASAGVLGVQMVIVPEADHR